MPEQAPERYDLWVCKDCRQPAHQTGDRCSRDRRRTWTQMDTIEYVRADLHSAAEAENRKLRDWILARRDISGPHVLKALLGE